MAKLQFGHPNSIDLAQLTLQLAQNGPVSYESLISVRLKSRNRSSGHPTRYL
ncbi:hypothetical protein LINPERHAP2_LOCUS11039 [Linum perenne]